MKSIEKTILLSTKTIKKNLKPSTNSFCVFDFGLRLKYRKYTKRDYFLAKLKKLLNE